MKDKMRMEQILLNDNNKEINSHDKYFNIPIIS